MRTVDPLEKGLSDLKSRGYQALSSLPESSTLEIPGEPRPSKLMVWKEMLGAERVRIVVQSLNVGCCAIGGVDARGFIMTPEGEVSAIPEEMMYEFRMTD